jgi:hypothetical protein
MTYLIPYTQKYVQKVKSKAIHITGRGGLRCCQTSRISHSVDNRLTDGGEVVSLTCRLRFTPREYFWYSFLSQAEYTLDRGADGGIR